MNGNPLAAPMAAAPGPVPIALRMGARHWAMAGLACLVLAFWMLIRTFRGLEHDSVLYGVLALARLHPAALGHDMFVRLGTQDRFTIFSPLFAGAIRILGLEPAAAVLTFASHAAFFGAAWLLARRLMPAAHALLAVGLLVALPSWYGANLVFSYIETFLTPRQPAEAFALAGLAAALYSRHRLAAACMLAALLLHPIIAAAGVVCWVVLSPGLTRPRMAAGICFATAMIVVLLSITGSALFTHFDAVWLDMLRDRLAYLFPTEWPASDWLNAGIQASAIAVGAVVAGHNDLRRFCLAALLTVAIGVLFSVISGDLLHVIFAAQLQTWRWLWLTGALSALLSPAIVLQCWRSGYLGRAAALLLLTAWITEFNDFAAVPAALACACALTGLWLRDPQRTRPIFIGACLVLAMGVILLLQQVTQLPSPLRALRGGSRPYLDRIAALQLLTFEGLLPAAVLAGTTYAVNRCARRTAMLIAALGASVMLSVAPYSLGLWTHAKFPHDRYAAFAPWRAAIPESAEVLWPDPPTLAWFELGRASYWSLNQMSGMVFSREVSMLGDHREAAVTPVLPTLGRTLASGLHYNPVPAGAGRSMGASPCAIPDVTFYASWVDLGPSPYPPVVPERTRPGDVLRLYRCPVHS